jgi:hypothetical protein
MMPRLESKKLLATPSFVAMDWREVDQETSHQGREKNRRNRALTSTALTMYHLVYHLRSRRFQSERPQLWFDMGHLPYWKS